MIVLIFSVFRTNKAIHGDSSAFDNAEKLILHYGGKRMHTCKSIPIDDDVTKSLGKPVDWRFQEKPTTWQQIETIFDTEHEFPLIRGPAGHFDVEENFLTSLDIIGAKLGGSLIFLEGESLSSDDTLEAHLKKKKIRIADSTVLQGSIYLPCVGLFRFFFI